jgi:predicted RNase H-like HicB family nuclease
MAEQPAHRRTYVVLVEHDRPAGTYSARVPALPDCNVQAASVDEALVQLTETIVSHLEVLTSQEQPLPADDASPGEPIRVSLTVPTHRLTGFDRVCTAGGPCRSLDRAQGGADTADSWAFTCATCWDLVCVSCQTTPVTESLVFCSECGAREAYYDSLPPYPDDELPVVAGTRGGLGANRAAARLAERTGIADVHRLDILALAARGHLRVVGEYREWPLYSVADLDRFQALDELRQLIAERQAWMVASITRREAANLLAVTQVAFDLIAAEHGLTPGRLGRFSRAKVEAIAATRRRRIGRPSADRDLEQEAER